MKDSECEWDEHAEAYEGQILDKDKSDFNEQFSTTNLWYADVRSTRPKLYSQNPYLYVDPETPEADLFAEIIERVVNVQKDKAWNLKARMCEVITGTKIQGRGYLKTSYKFDKDKIGRQWAGEEPNDEVNIAYVPRDRLLIDAEATAFARRRWGAHKIHAPIEEIRDKFGIKKEIKISVIEETDLPKGISADEKLDFQFGCYYEIENIQDHTLSIIVDGMDGWAVKPYETPNWIQDSQGKKLFWSMYDALEWNEIPGRIDTKGDLHFWHRLLIELCEIETQELNHRRKLNSKYIARGQTELTSEQINDLKSYKDGIVIQLPPGTTVDAFQHATLGQENYLRKQSVRQDIGVISGMDEMKQGLPQSEKTAREAMLIAAENQSVIQFMSGRVEDMVSSVILKCIRLIQKNYDSTRVMALTGMEEAEYLGLKDNVQKHKVAELLGDSKRPFISFVGTKLKGEFGVRVKAGSAMPVNEAQRRNDIEMVITLMGKDPEFSANVDKKELGKEVAKILHIENKNIIIDPKSPEQENELLKRNIPVMPMLNEDHADHWKRHDLENNRTPAFINHQLGHKLMQSFIEKSQMAGAAPNMPQGMGNILNQQISGLPQGSAVPPAGVPQPPGGPATTPTTGGPQGPLQ